jgi:sulfur transfer protein SufE
VAQFDAAGDAKGRLRLLLEYARKLPPFPEEFKTVENRVMGCTAQVRARRRGGRLAAGGWRPAVSLPSRGCHNGGPMRGPRPAAAPSRTARPTASHPTQAWVHAALAADGTVRFSAASDSEVTAGLAGVLVAALSGLTPAEVAAADASWLRALGLGGAAGAVGASRANGFANMLEAMRRRARMLTADLPAFPSLRITRDSLEPQARARGGEGPSGVLGAAGACAVCGPLGASASAGGIWLGRRCCGACAVDGAPRARPPGRPTAPAALPSPLTRRRRAHSPRPRRSS